MERPQVRLIEDQTVENKPVEVSGWEAEQLLRKYGYNDQSFSTRENAPVQQEMGGLTVEEMIAQEESRLREQEMRRKSQMCGPKPTTFDGRNGYDSEVKYGSDDDTGFGFKIQIVSDMPIPKY